LGALALGGGVFFSAPPRALERNQKIKPNFPPPPRAPGPPNERGPFFFQAFFANLGTPTLGRSAGNRGGPTSTWVPRPVFFFFVFSTLARGGGAGRGAFRFGALVPPYAPYGPPPRPPFFSQKKPPAPAPPPSPLVMFLPQKPRNWNLPPSNPAGGGGFFFFFSYPAGPPCPPPGPRGPPCPGPPPARPDPGGACPKTPPPSRAPRAGRNLFLGPPACFFPLSRAGARHPPTPENLLAEKKKPPARLLGGRFPRKKIPGVVPGEPACWVGLPLPAPGPPPWPHQRAGPGGNPERPRKNRGPKKKKETGPRKPLGFPPPVFFFFS